LWNRGDEVFRVTARKDEWGEVESLEDGKTAWICNTCRFEKKKTSDWVIEGPRQISRHSVISQGHYQGNIGMTLPQETFPATNSGRQPKLLMDIHSVSEVNKPTIELSLIEGPAHATDFNSKKD
jgi:NADH-quinone oxidoreductase subunit G